MTKDMKYFSHPLNSINQIFKGAFSLYEKAGVLYYIKMQIQDTSTEPVPEEQNDIRVQQRFRSFCDSAQSGQILCRPHKVLFCRPHKVLFCRPHKVLFCRPHKVLFSPYLPNECRTNSGQI